MEKKIFTVGTVYNFFGQAYECVKITAKCVYFKDEWNDTKRFIKNGDIDGVEYAIRDGQYIKADNIRKAVENINFEIGTVYNYLCQAYECVGITNKGVQFKDNWGIIRKFKKYGYIDNTEIASRGSNIIKADNIRKVA